jgi:hypothetical protein
MAWSSSFSMRAGERLGKPPFLTLAAPEVEGQL